MSDMFAVIASGLPDGRDRDSVFLRVCQLYIACRGSSVRLQAHTTCLICNFWYLTVFSVGIGGDGAGRQLGTEKENEN